MFLDAVSASGDPEPRLHRGETVTSRTTSLTNGIRITPGNRRLKTAQIVGRCTFGGRQLYEINIQPALIVRYALLTSAPMCGALLLAALPVLINANDESAFSALLVSVVALTSMLIAFCRLFMGQANMFLVVGQLATTAAFLVIVAALLAAVGWSAYQETGESFSLLTAIGLAAAGWHGLRRTLYPTSRDPTALDSPRDVLYGTVRTGKPREFTPRVIAIALVSIYLLNVATLLTPEYGGSQVYVVVGALALLLFINVALPALRWLARENSVTPLRLLARHSEARWNEGLCSAKTPGDSIREFVVSRPIRSVDGPGTRETVGALSGCRLRSCDHGPVPFRHRACAAPTMQLGLRSLRFRG